MTRKDVLKKLNEIFQEVFDNESIQIGETTTSEDIEEWDSLEHINLMVAVEQSFGIKFSIEEMTDLKNVGELIRVILQKI